MAQPELSTTFRFENLNKQELLIERAQGQYLIDNDGEHYLDLINNVAHGKFFGVDLKS